MLDREVLADNRAKRMADHMRRLDTPVSQQISELIC
jgi:hypothetical protein